MSMTRAEVDACFATHTYSEARKILRAEAAKNGYKNGESWSKAQLIAYAMGVDMGVDPDEPAADAEETGETETLSVVNVPPLSPATAEAPAADSVEAALALIAKAVKTPKAPPPAVNEAALIAKAVQAAKEAASNEAKDVLKKDILTFIKDGTLPVPAPAEPVVTADARSAKGDGVTAAAKAHSWSAKATPAATAAVEKLTKFLSEFSYFRTGVSMRLVNTFAIAADKKDAIVSYCEVSQMEDLPDIKEKLKSPEFAAVVAAFNAFHPKPLNRRFAVFYGAPGGGKTYAAIEAGKAINGDGKVDVVPCSPSMDAADTLYAYRLDYKTGKRGYIPTALLDAMTMGRAVVLDEVNLLPMEARMFLQNILDNKDKVHVMGEEIAIKPGFFVLGTMNIETGLGSQPLPLPLVDRAAVVKEFRATTAQTAVGAGLC